MKSITLSLLISFSTFIVVAQQSFSVTYTYDDAGRLIGANYQDSIEILYTYDLSGNMLSRTVQQVTPVSNKPSGKQELLWEIYPNPANDFIQIKLSDFPPISGQLTSTTGKMIHRKIFENKNNIKLKLEDVPSGIYFLKLYNKERSETHKITLL